MNPEAWEQPNEPDARFMTTPELQTTAATEIARLHNEVVGTLRQLVSAELEKRCEHLTGACNKLLQRLQRWFCYSL